jgi:hypothetical protein
MSLLGKLKPIEGETNQMMTILTIILNTMSFLIIEHGYLSISREYQKIILQIVRAILLQEIRKALQGNGID